MVATDNKQFLGGIRNAALDTGLMVAITAFLAFMFFTGRPGQLGVLVHDKLQGSFGFWVSIQFLVLVPLIFLLEYIMPARPEQKGFSPNVALDALYMLIHLPVISAFMVFISAPINNFLADNASFLVVDSTRSWPLWLAAVVGLMITDFGTWFAHLLKHKVSWFWRFHMIHHSQPRMSLFTSNRTHPVDALIDNFVLLGPFFFFFPSITEQAGAVFLIGLLAGWSAKFQHANIFAWDRLFGTQHSDITSYPPTGINDPYFPEPEHFSVSEFASCFVGQMLFPFDQEAVTRASTGSPYDSSDSPAY